MSRLHRRVNDVRTHHLHCLTTRLAQTHSRIVVEGLDAAGMLRQKGLPGARTRRRGLSDAALGTPRRHLSYKTGWDEHWTCDVCSARHQRDDNASINLARYEETVSAVGPVGAAVKPGADPKTRPSRAGGR